MNEPWPANSAFGPDGLSISGIAAASLAERFGTPLFVLDEDDFRARCHAFGEAFPRVLFAVKAFPARTLILAALDQGLGLLTSTDGELQACLRAGADPSRIALHGNNKSDAELLLAVESGVGLVIADNADELERLDRIAEVGGRVQPVLLRVAPDVSGETHAYLDTGGAESKFGTPIGDGRALAALKMAHAAAGLELKGVHAHVGSQLLSADPYLLEVDRLFQLLAEARDAFGMEPELVDVGGGFAAAYTDERPPDPADLAALIAQRVRAAGEARGLRAPTLMVEPGRALAANPVVTLYTVGSVKETPSGATIVAVDGGMSDNIRPALYGAKYEVAEAGRGRSDVRSPGNVVGRHCESGDVLATGVSLPADVRPGDLLAFAATGAYGYAMASNYNKAGRPAVVSIRNGRARLIIRREDHADLERLEVDTPAEPERAGLPDGLVVRPARPSDAKGFHRMWQEVLLEGMVRSQEVSRPLRHYKALFRNPWSERGAWIVAAAGDDVVGFLSIARDDQTASSHIATLGLGVDRGWRNRGIGTALLVESLRWARSHGLAKVILSVYPDNAPAIALYRRFGFLEEGRMAGHSLRNGNFEDEILMGKWLG